MQLGFDELIGALPDAIAWAIAQVIKAVSGEVISQIIDYGFGPLLTISNPMGNADALAAWDQTAGIAIALLPLLIAGNLIVMPFSENRDGGMWAQVLRGVGILMFIAVSKPLWGFSIDAVNALTVELLPPAFKLTFANNLLDGWGTLLSIFLYPAVAIMMFLAFVFSVLLLVLRWLVVWLVFIGAPLFAVLWYPNIGPMKSVSKFAAVFLRMGVYMLFAGPIIAIVLRVFSVIMTGGVITGQGGVSGTILELGVSIVMIVAMPLVLFVVVYKTVSWAGQPLGVGEVFGMAVAGTVAAVGAATAIAGGAAVAGGGAAAAGGGGAAAGSGGGGAGATAGGSAGGAAAGGSSATDPSAATDNSTIGSGMRQSIGESLSANQPESAVEADAQTPGERFGAWARTKKKSLPGGKISTAISKKRQSTATRLKEAGIEGGRLATGTEVVDTMREKQASFANKARMHQANAGFLDAARTTGKLDVKEASDRGLLDSGSPPKESEISVPVEKVGETRDGQGVYEATYTTSEGEQATFNVSGAHESELYDADRAAGAADQWAQRTSDARAAGRGLKQIAKTSGNAGLFGVKTSGRAAAAGGKISTAAMIGGVTSSPYLGHRVGKSIGNASPKARARSLLIGSNPEPATVNPRQSEQESRTSASKRIETEEARDSPFLRDSSDSTASDDKKFDAGHSF